MYVLESVNPWRLAIPVVGENPRALLNSGKIHTWKGGGRAGEWGSKEGGEGREGKTF